MRRWVKVLQIAAVVGCVALAAALAAVLSRGGSSADAPAKPVHAVAAADAGTASVDPCTLITAGEAADTLGSTPTKRSSDTSCTYTVVGSGFRSLSVVLGPQGTDPASFHDGMSSYAQAANASLFTVSGVGDEAYATFSDTVDQLVARSGSTYVTLVLINFTGAQSDILTTLQTLGQTALSRVH
jgi:hypothetical protein